MKNLFTKIFTLVAIIVAVSSTLLTIAAPSVEAVTPRTFGSCNVTLGFKPWDCGVSNAIDSETALKSNIWLIAVNVAEDITVAAAYLVLGFVIYGGYLYIFSSGDPGKVASGKKTLIHAFFGLAIVVSANLIMNTIRLALFNGSGAFDCDLATGTNCIDSSTAGSIIANSIQWIIGVAGVVAVIFIVYGGISFILSNGNPDQVKKAKQTILYAVIGLLVVALAEIITAFITQIVNDANAYAPQTIISKEVHEINSIN